MRQLSTSTPKVANIKGQVPLSLGGTGQNNSEEAAQFLNVVPVSSIGKKNGVARLESNLQVPQDVLPRGSVNYATLDGPDNVYVSQSVVYTITNYDAKSEYNVSVSSGNVSRNGAQITYIASSVPGLVQLSINQRTVEFNVKSLAPEIPTIVSPVQSASNIPSVVTLTGTDFRLPLGIANHQLSDWELATDLSFQNIVASSYNDAVSKTQWTYAGLLANKTYYGRVRYKDQLYGFSGWSNPVAFRTKSAFTPPAEVAKLTQNVPTAQANFGSVISFDYSGNRVAIGAPLAGGTGSAIGTVYVFRKNNGSWILEQAIVATGLPDNNLANGDNFGKGVKMNAAGDMIAIGAPNKTPQGTAFTNSGLIYIYTRTGNTWVRQSVITASDHASNLLFGSDIDSNPTMTRIAVGAPGATVSGQTNCGAIYIFNRSGNTWTQEAKLVMTTAIASAQMARTVRLSADGSRAAGSCWQEPSGGNTIGSIYVFVRNGTTWSQEAKLVSNTAGTNEAFGYSFAIEKNGNYIFSGQPGNIGDTNTTVGRVLLFKRTGSTWTYVSSINPTDTAKRNRFGTKVSLDMSGSILAVAADRNADGAVTLAGAVFLYNVVNEVATQTAELKGSDITTTNRLGGGMGLSPDGLTVGAASLDKVVSSVTGGATYIFS